MNLQRSLMSQQGFTNPQFTQNSSVPQNERSNHHSYSRPKDKPSLSILDPQKYQTLNESNDDSYTSVDSMDIPITDTNRDTELNQEVSKEINSAKLPKNTYRSSRNHSAKLKSTRIVTRKSNRHHHNNQSRRLSKRSPLNRNNDRSLGRINTLRTMRKPNDTEPATSTDRNKDEDYLKSSDRFNLIPALNTGVRINLKDGYHNESNDNEEIINNGPNIYDNELINYVPETSEPMMTQAEQNNNNDITGDTAVEIQQLIENGENSGRVEETLYLNKIIAFSVGMGSTAITLLLIIFKSISFKWLFGVLCTYLVYTIFESVWRNKKYQRESWRKREDIFNVLESISGLIFFVWTGLRIVGIAPSLQYCYLPFMITTIAYILSTNAPNSVLLPNILIRCAYAMQALLISLKFDDVIDYDWEFIFVWLWIYFGYFVIYLTGFAVILVFLVVDFLYKLCTRQLSGNDHDIIGMTWFLLIHTYALCGVYGIVGIGQAYNATQDFSGLKMVGIETILLTIIIVSYTLIYYKKIGDFLYKFNLEQQMQMNESLHGEAQSPIIKPEGKLQTEKKESYFIMMSPTYFLPLRNQSLAKDQANLQRVKGMLSKLKVWRLGSLHLNKQQKPKEPINVKTLKQYKDVLDNKFNSEAKPSVITFRKMKNTKEDHRPQMNQTAFQRSIRNLHKSKASVELSAPHLKPQFSFNDLDNIKMLDLSPLKRSKSEEEDDTCYVCCTNTANAIMMNCGHAGVCYECAEMLIKKEKGCTECRGKIEAIYKIDPNPKFSNIIKGFEIGTIAEPEPQPELLKRN